MVVWVMPDRDHGNGPFPYVFSFRNITVIASGIQFYMSKITVQSSLMEDEDYEHSASGEVSDRSKKRCHVISNLLTSLARSFLYDLTAIGPYCHDLRPIFPSMALALGFWGLMHGMHTDP